MSFTTSNPFHSPLTSQTTAPGTPRPSGLLRILCRRALAACCAGSFLRFFEILSAQRNKFLVFAALFSALAFPLVAQDEGTEGEEERPPIDSRWQDAAFETFSKGDTTFNINLGVIFPVAFSVGDAAQYDPPVGGNGMLSGSYFLNSHVFVGGGVQGMFVPTIGEHMLYIVPMGAHIGYEWVFGRFEFPVSLMVGWAWQMYLSHLYFGVFAKPQVSVLFRAFNDWSFGLNAAWWFVPQWGTRTENDTGGIVKGRDVVGNFFELTLMAQYHF